MAAGGHGFGMVIADAESDEKAMLKGIPVFEPAGAPFLDWLFRRSCSHL
jgi:hypothetical protein